MLFINNTPIEEQQEIGTYITSFVEKTKNDWKIDYTSLFISSVKNNLWIAICIWFAGLTVIGIFVVYGVICFRGFTLGYSVSSIVATLGTKSRWDIYFIFNASTKHNIYTSIICNIN